jgi:hypothetical protein
MKDTKKIIDVKFFWAGFISSAFGLRTTPVLNPLLLTYADDTFESQDDFNSSNDHLRPVSLFPCQKLLTCTFLSHWTRHESIATNSLIRPYASSMYDDQRMWVLILPWIPVEQ